MKRIVDIVVAVALAGALGAAPVEAQQYDSLWVACAAFYPENATVYVPVHCELGPNPPWYGVTAIQIMFGNDPGITIDDIHWDGTSLGLDPTAVEIYIGPPPVWGMNNAGPTYRGGAATFSFASCPFIPAPGTHLLCYLEISTTSAGWFHVAPVNGLGNPPIWNSFAYLLTPSDHVGLAGCDLYVRPGVPFVRGDTDADGGHGLFDCLHIIYWTGGSAPEPPCIKTADIDDDGEIDLFDGLRCVYWLGGQADPPPPPCCAIPHSCGQDPTPDELTCNSYPPCEGYPKTVAERHSVGLAEESRLAAGEAIFERDILVTPVTLTNAEPLIGFSFTVEYDPELLTAKLVDNAGLVTEDFDVFAAGVSEPGIVKVAAVSDMDIADGVEKLPTGQHRVATIVFELNEKALDRDVPLRVTSSAMAISHNRALNHQTVDGVIKRTAELPQKFGLAQNYPNPFNPATEIRYDLPRDCRATLEVFNVLGQRVRTLVDEDQTVGYKSVIWNSRNDRGEEVTAGVYFYRLMAGDFCSIRKMVLLR